MAESKNFFGKISYIIAIAVTFVLFLGIQHYSKFKRDNHLKPVMAQYELLKLISAMYHYKKHLGIYPEQAYFENAIHFYNQTASKKASLQDPWGKTYIYQKPGPDYLPYRIISHGADGQPGGIGKDQDLISDDLLNEFLNDREK